MIRGLRREPSAWLTAVALVGLLLGVACWVAGADGSAEVIWAVTAATGLPLMGVALVVDLRQRKIGLDLIALLALGGALLYHQFLAGALIALMIATGQALEAVAGARARAELAALLARAPRSTQRYTAGGVETVPVDAIVPGDRLLVTTGDVLPVDGTLTGLAVLDESALTGEPLPVEHRAGDDVRSGCVNAGPPFDLVAGATAAASTYAGIVRLVKAAEAEKAPFVRLADRYAAIFLPLTLTVAGLAWIISGNPVRALAVLVVATPCPLILAAPVAIVAGISRAAQRGVIVKGGGALETLARATIVLLDKTGTITAGSPTLRVVVPLDTVASDEVLRLAASLDQASAHVLALAIVRAGRDRGLGLRLPTDVVEEAGKGIRGSVDGRLVAIGRRSWVEGDGHRGGAHPASEPAVAGATSVYVAIDGKLSGVLHLADPVRPDAAQTIAELRRAGVQEVAMLTGDQPSVAERIGKELALDRVLARQSPADKIAAVRSSRASGTVVMVGDGINDAPALAAADVGVAMGARGATASSEAADVVVLVDRLDRLATAMRIARRARRIAQQSVMVGMGLSLAAMGIAALGFLPPPAGALLQELIDVGVILNALRALRVEDESRSVRERVRTRLAAASLPVAPSLPQPGPSAPAER